MIKVAVLWIINNNEEVLLAQRAHHKAQDPSVWGPTVTGKLEPSETFNDALTREVHEEIGLQSNEYSATFLLEKDFHHPDGEIRKFGIYCAKLPSSITEKIMIDPSEVAGVRWFPLADIVKTMQETPSELVPSAGSVWPQTFAAIWPDTYKALRAAQAA